MSQVDPPTVSMSKKPRTDQGHTFGDTTILLTSIVMSQVSVFVVTGHDTSLGCTWLYIVTWDMNPDNYKRP